jgi:hypothetical protein
MAAANTDLFRKVARRWVGQIGSGGVADGVVTTIPLSSATSIPTDTGVTAVIDRVDSNGASTPTLEETIIGVVSGSNLITCTRGVEGTAQAHSAGAVVELLITADGYNDIIDGILVDHGQLGRHKTLTDANGNEWIIQTATTSAVNEITVANAATGSGPIISATGGDTNIPVNIKPKGSGSVNLVDGNGNENLKTGQTASAVNEVTITNAATGNPPTVSATGDDTNIELKLIAKGTGKIREDARYGVITTNSDGATVTFNCATSNIHTVTLGGNRTLALSNDIAGQVLLLHLKQDGTGSRTVTWFSGISWAGGSAPTLTTTINKTDTLGIQVVTAGSAYYGYVVGQNI